MCIRDSSYTSFLIWYKMASVELTCLGVVSLFSLNWLVWLTLWFISFLLLCMWPFAVWGMGSPCIHDIMSESLLEGGLEYEFRNPCIAIESESRWGGSALLGITAFLQLLSQACPLLFLCGLGQGLTLVTWTSHYPFIGLISYCRLCQTSVCTEGLKCSFLLMLGLFDITPGWLRPSLSCKFYMFLSAVKIIRLFSDVDFIESITCITCMFLLKWLFTFLGDLSHDIV